MSAEWKCRFPAFLCTVIVLSGFCGNANGDEYIEYFSSVAGMEKLLAVEFEMLNDLQNYINSMQKQIDLLQSEVDAIRLDHQAAVDDVDGYLSNPVNAYRLIKRLQSDWSAFEESVRIDSSRTDFLSAMAANRRQVHFPSKEDVIGSAVALVRLQDTYKLEVAELASGVLNGIKYGPSMSWQDCFLLGHYLYEIQDFNHTVPWLRESMELLKNEEYDKDAVTLDFMETVLTYHQEMGDFQTALELTNYILSIDAQRDQLRDTKYYLERMLSDGVKTGLMHEIAPNRGDYHLSDDYKRYEQVCRGELQLTPTEERPLRCRYDSNNVPHRLLQPYKVEELHLDPRVVQIHDVISTHDMEAVKRLAQTRMSRSQVRNLNGSAASTANYRISKSAWFAYEESEHMQTMKRHMGDISGLNMASAEHLQVANYGIGGHYEPHFDFFTDNCTFKASEGNRLATGIFYLSDVAEGGGTAFPYLRLLVRPQRGSVLFWHNLHRSEEPDYRTRHAACPVLKGSKWIGNIWVRVRNQDRERPCGLLPDHEVSLEYKHLV